MLHKEITLYNGNGATTLLLTERLRDSFHGAIIRKTNGDGVKNSPILNRDTLAFFLPGIIGEYSPYKEQLGEEGNQIIRSYVEQGGVFVGICAGAYYACEDILYNPPWFPEPKTAKSGLNFFNAQARGPLQNFGLQGKEQRFSDCLVTTVSYKSSNETNKQTGIAYGNGPMLIPHDNANDLEVLARYEDAENTPIAIATQKVGKGLAIFIGVLPYIGYEENFRLDAYKDLNELMEQLKPHEQGREEIWQMITDKIKQHNADLGRVKLYNKSHPKL